MKIGSCGILSSLALAACSQPPSASEEINSDAKVGVVQTTGDGIDIMLPEETVPEEPISAPSTAPATPHP